MQLIKSYTHLQIAFATSTWKDSRYHKRSTTCICFHLGSLISELCPCWKFESISGLLKPSCAQHNLDGNIRVHREKKDIVNFRYKKNLSLISIVSLELTQSLVSWHVERCIGPIRDPHQRLKNRIWTAQTEQRLLVPGWRGWAPLHWILKISCYTGAMRVPIWFKEWTSKETTVLWF